MTDNEDAEVTVRLTSAQAYAAGYRAGKANVEQPNNLADLLAQPAFREAVEWAKRAESEPPPPDLAHVGAEIHAKWKAEELDDVISRWRQGKDPKPGDYPLMAEALSDAHARLGAEFERGVKVGREHGYSEAMLARFENCAQALEHGDITREGVGVLVHAAEQAMLTSCIAAFEELVSKYSQHPYNTDVPEIEIRDAIAQLEKEHPR